jgi:cellulose synthase/poly-beta-1,6-N-acetylglucosamine synthase-like glycosyltransferase
MTGVLISVVIPTYHRNQLLDRCLAALVDQDFDPCEFEIIVVDDGSDEGTRKLVDQWAERTHGYRLEHMPVASREMLRTMDSLDASMIATSILQDTVLRLAYLPMVRYINVTGQRHGPARARNLGWRAAVGEIIAFTDDDCIPQRDWLKNGLAAIENMDGISGQVIVPLGNEPTDYELNARGLEHSEFVTANCFYRKSALEEVGGFDERFTSAWREDTDLFFSLLENGYALGHEPAAVVIHPIRPASWGVSLRQQQKNQFNALLYKKHPVNYSRRLHARPPVVYYASLLSLGIFLTGIALNFPIISITGIAAWVAMVTGFILHRLRNTSHSAPHILEMVVTSILIPPLAVFWRIRGALRYRVPFL